MDQSSLRRSESRLARCATALLVGALGCDRSARAAGSSLSWQQSSTSRTQASFGASRTSNPGDREAMLAQLRVPTGFRVSVFASGLENPRMLVVDEAGAVYVSRSRQGDVLVLRDRDRDGVAEARETAARGLENVNGLALAPAQLFLATPTRVYVAERRADETVGSPRVVADNLPEAGRHANRTLAIGPDAMLYVSVGSSCNACVERNPEHATMLRMGLDGSRREVFARGLRNTIGFDWHPSTRALWGMDHGSDERGNDVPPEELNLLERGAHYGWPHCLGERVPDPLLDARPPSGDPASFCASTRAPALGYQAHSAPMAFVFYTGTMFPSGYRGDAFVALRGSWNREPATGYKVLRVRFAPDGTPTGFEDFLTGFLSSDAHTRTGRPVGLALAHDGALLVSDELNGVLYRVSYGGPATEQPRGP